MFDTAFCQEVLTCYKQDFSSIWKNEKYKWEAVQCFQDHWDPDAADFAAMLTASLAKTDHLLASSNYYPREMLLRFAGEAAEEVRSMFLSLFDENEDVVKRIGNFKTQADSLLEKSESPSHYQTENAVTTYLWLRYPDQYYFYKFEEVKTVADKIKANFPFKKGAYAENICNFLQLYDEVNQVVKADAELVKLFQSNLTPGCYPDPELKTLTVDFGFFISRYFPDEQWQPQNYTPGLSVQDWKALLSDPEIFKPVSLELMKLFKAHEGVASCKELSDQYGKSWQFYNNNISALAKRIAKEKNLSVDGEWWPILCLAKYYNGSCHFKLRKELSQALDQVDLSDVPLYADEENPPTEETNDSDRREPNMSSNQIYSEDDFLKEVFLHRERYRTLVERLRHKKNVILQGPPGVGKSFSARRLAWSMLGKQDNSRIELVQFHQSYSYEDFVMGYKPKAEGFELKAGIFHRFCQKAREEPEKEFFFLIDEINRGNLSKIFGELLMLIENGYREHTATIACTGEEFSVPKNLYLIGMMNTADRSLALIDYALRRRFSFFELAPAFDSDGFRHYQKKLNSGDFDALVDKVKELNQEILQDKSLGKGFCIGHSYFCGMDAKECTREALRSIVEFDILPTLEEYWFDDQEKFTRWENILKGVLP